MRYFLSFIALLFFTQILFAQEAQDSKEATQEKQVALKEYDNENNKIFELFADNLDSINYTTIIATGNAVIISQDMYVIADYIKYNTQTREADISGNVKFYRDGSLFLSTQKGFVRFDEDYFVVEPFYMQDSKSGVWISASFAENKDDEYNLKDIVVSGCDIDSPIWHIEGSSGYYNQDSSIASIWNPRIYIKNIPIMYFPYFFISTQNKRTTGLLYPEFASSTLDGFVYIQPFFLALQDFWDMTISPQVRTSRGLGFNTQARVIDPSNKMFELNAGIFWNNNKYKNRYNIENQIVFGFNFNHERRNLINEFIDFDGDGLYLDFKYMNDLDYIRLQSTKDTTIEDRLQTSRANYFMNKDEHFLGLYFKYFLDLSKLSNSDTFQTLPQFQYHRSLEQTEIKNILYSIDVNAKNITRSSGFGYFDNSIQVPLYFTTPIFADYLTIGANANLSANVITLNNIGNTNIQNRNSTYFGATYGVFLNSNVAKQYDKIFHTMSFNASFTSPLYQYFDDDNQVFSSNATNTGLFGTLNNITTTQQQVQLTFSQYFFGLGGIELVYHRMYQDINPQDEQSKLANLRNEIGFSPISNIDIMTTIFYSHFYNDIEEASLSLNTRFGYFQGNLTYFFKKKFTFNDARIKYTEEAANFLRLRLSNDFGYFALYGDIGYDFKLKYLRDWNIIISKDIRCFGIGLRFANEIVPILTTIGSQTVRNTYVSLEFRFVPVTATSFSYRFKESIQ
ncbi:hypothetical protein CCY99_04555 [Helicobacter sp. 16-1353]|uniref:LPS-assembly protein LptD n=1 Tax=Helicobacter sp. 16-1353 TaxID=2004996 RepID=UPI000DCDABA2|nr:LPS-assembly protein LptD [Helicobacter sp. 16-1353]RAX54287.1 hypothetical protein CCY99_04555 [Helicobacter sp. 16-1353]